MAYYQIQNKNNWSIAYSSVLTTPLTPDGYKPFQPITLPITFQSHLLMIECKNDKALERWYLGAYVSQLINVPALIRNQTQLSRKIARINYPTILQFPKYTTDYQLKIEIPYWFSFMGITIMEYIGQEGDPNDQLQRIEDRVNLIESAQ